MSFCVINDRRFEIDIVSSPISGAWLDLHGNKKLRLMKKFQHEDLDRLYEILADHLLFWKKLKLDDLVIKDKSQLLRKKVLANIHNKIVKMQRVYKNSTDLFNANTGGDWNLLHDKLHELEGWIDDIKIKFNADISTGSHDALTNKKYWEWSDRITLNDWACSTTFLQSHLELVTTELGRVPWECFRHCPDNWEEEGSLSGNLVPVVDMSLNRIKRSAPAEFVEWSKKNNLPIIGNRIPLANFRSDDFIDVMCGLDEDGWLMIEP